MISRLVTRAPLMALLFTLLLSVPQTLSGQAVNGTLLGTVNDATGATVSNAKVVATQTSMGAIHETMTNESGNYTFPDIQPGPYSVAVEAAGFKKAVQENIVLVSNSSIRVDIELQTGNVTETIQVTTAPPLLQTDRADITTKIETEQVLNMPLGTNRNFQSLINLVPGAAPAVFQHSQFFNAAGSLQTEVNGLPRQGNLYQIEGIDDDERTGLLQIIIPPAEAISSVDISTNNFEAELGRATGAVTNVTLKSGTNTWHGSAFEFIQNNARTPAPTLADPLAICPTTTSADRLADRSSRTSCSSSVTILRTADHEKVSSTFTIPDSRYITNAGHTPGCSDPVGCIDLSAAYNGTKGQIYDPATGDGKTTHRTPFPNNQIPYSRVNPVSLNTLQLLNEAAVEYGKLTTKPLNNPSNNYTTTLPFTKTTTALISKRTSL